MTGYYRPGVYMIRDVYTNEFYIGSSINVGERINTHFRKLYLKKHTNSNFQSLYDGGAHFVAGVIEFCDIDKLLEVETKYISELKPTINILSKGLALMMGKKHSSETKKKFKSRRYPKGKNHYNYGKKLPEDVKRKMIESRTGLKRSEETKRKMSLTAKRLNNYQHIEKYVELSKRKIIDSEGNEYESLVECSKKLNRSVSSVCDNLKGRTKYITDKKLKLYYKEDVNGV